MLPSGEKGHTVKRCKQPIVDQGQENAGHGEGFSAAANDTSGHAGGGGDWNTGADNAGVNGGTGQSEWESITPAPVVTATGGGNW